MGIDDTQQAIDVLACDITQRPREAPSIFDIAPSIRRMDRRADAVVVEFEPAAGDAVAAFVAAERRCCAGIGWELEREPALRLRVTASAGQLEVLVHLFAQQW